MRRFTPHDLRSTVKSHLRALGVPRDISERCLNHKLSGVEGIYDRHTYFEERREALGKWAAVLVAVDTERGDALVRSCPALPELLAKALVRRIPSDPGVLVQRQARDTLAHVQQDGEPGWGMLGWRCSFPRRR